MDIQSEKWKEHREHYRADEIIRVITAVDIILKKHDSRLLDSTSPIRLTDRIEDFAQLVLSLAAHYYLNYEQAQINYESYKHAAELQNLIQTLKRLEGRHMEIVFKIPGRPFKVESEGLSRWIRKTLIKAYNKFDVTTGDFGHAMFLLDAENNFMKSHGNAEILEQYAKKPPSFNRFIYNFCDTTMTYMDQTFTLATHDASYLSEAQLSFLYELLCLLRLEGFGEEYDIDEYANPLDRDRLYQLLNRQRKLKR